jgi:TonB family protein
MANRSALLAACVLAVAPARAAAAEPPAAALVPAGPAYPIDPGPAEATPSGVPAVGEVAPPRITDVADVPAAPPEAAPSPPVASAPPEAVVAEPPAPLTASQRETLRFQMKSYLRQVHERVRAAWAAPVTAERVARREALVTVVIGRDGRVVETRLDRSSRDEGFDRSALRVLGRRHLFPPLPPYYETDALEVGLRFADPARSAR